MVNLIKREVITPDPGDWDLPRVQETKPAASDTQFGVKVDQLTEQPQAEGVHEEELAPHAVQHVTHEQRLAIDPAQGPSNHRNLA